MSAVEIVEKQNEIIRIQAGVIDELFSLLMQHVSAEEASKLACVERISTAVKLQQEIE